MGRKRFWLLAAAVAALVFWRFGYQASLRYFFRISGTIALSPGAVPPLPANTMLFVVARNESGVPVAVKKMINPVFPLEFEIAQANLIMPDLLTRRMTVEALLNTHGRLGVLERGDLKGDGAAPVAVYAKRVRILLNSPGK